MDGRHCLASALAALAFLLPAAARANCKIETAELPITMVGVRAVAMVRINGTNVPMMVDSGAFYSFLTEAATSQLKLSTRSMPGRVVVQGLGGKVDSRVAVVDKLGLLGGEVPDVEFIVGGTDPGGGAMGIIGRNILSVADTEYDLAHGVIRLVFPNDDCKDANMAYWAGKQPVSVVDLLRDNNDWLGRPAIHGIVSIDGQKQLALFDSGASSTVLTLHAAHRLGLADKDMQRIGVTYGADGRAIRSWSAAFAKIDVGGEVISNNRLAVADLQVDEDMLLGIDFFLSHHLYVSKKRRLMFLTYNGGRIFAANRTDPAAVSASGAASAASSADDAGLDADGYARRGAASASRGDAASALADLDRAVALAPTSAAFLAQRAQLHLQLRDTARARADIDKALQLDPQQADARLQRATMRAQAKDVDGALADLDELDRQLAPEAQPRGEMGRLYMTLRAPARALVQFDRWLPHHAHEAEIEVFRYDRCWVRVLLNQSMDKALDDCDAAVDAKPGNAGFLGGRGWVYLRQGRLSKAKADFDRSLAIRPASALTLYGRSAVEQRLGDATASQADLEAARKQSASIEADMARLGLDKERTAPQ